MGFLDSLKHGLERSREAISEVFYMGGEEMCIRDRRNTTNNVPW